MRLTAIILLLLILPRVTLAVQSGSLICFGGDHVETDCHESAVDPCGESEPADAPQAPHDPCIDVSAAPVSLASRVGIDLGDAPAAYLVLLPALLAETPSVLVLGPDRANESPPRFGARAFATFISPRT